MYVTNIFNHYKSVADLSFNYSRYRRKVILNH